MADLPTPEELHDWRKDRHGLDRKRPLVRILYAALIANAALWCGAQGYLTVDYVQQLAAEIEEGL